MTSSERAHSILRDINKKGVEIGERQNRCHDDIYIYMCFGRYGSGVLLIVVFGLSKNTIMNTQGK